ncbi:hypothetical protein GCM10010279_23560 [Streptomyces mutabilis]|nr:hypothetical protein GCM10010279_23560 [Streptomyces mutabilis]
MTKPGGGSGAEGYWRSCRLGDGPTQGRVGYLRNFVSVEWVPAPGLLGDDAGGFRDHLVGDPAEGFDLRHQGLVGRSAGPLGAVQDPRPGAGVLGIRRATVVV